MARNPGCAVYIGNLDEKVSERVLYEILIQVGRVVDLHIPRDKESSRPRGYAFAEYETEEIAQYAVRLFSGLVRLHNRTLKFAISGQDKPSSNGSIPGTPKMNPIPLSQQPQQMRSSDTPVSQHAVVNGRIASYGVSPSHSAGYGVPPNHSAGYGVPPNNSVAYGVSPNHSYDFHSQAPSGVASRGLTDGTYEYSRRVFGSVLNDVSRPSARQPIPYPSY